MPLTCPASYAMVVNVAHAFLVMSKTPRLYKKKTKFFGFFGLFAIAKYILFIVWYDSNRFDLSLNNIYMHLMHAHNIWYNIFTFVVLMYVSKTALKDFDKMDARLERNNMILSNSTPVATHCTPLTY